MSEISDENLMRLYQQGDSAAFEALYKRHSAQVYGYLKTRLESRVEADEIFQAVFLKFHRLRLKYDPSYPVLQWLFVISKSVLIDHFRKKQRQIQIEVDVPLESISGGLSQKQGSSALKELQAEELALASLSDEQRQVIQWRVLDDLSYEQIAERMNRSEVSIRQTFSRSIRKLRTLMQVKKPVSRSKS
jgi:RNA polymerase sigma factor (sigma-70 family)